MPADESERSKVPRERAARDDWVPEYRWDEWRKRKARERELKERGLRK